MAVNEFRQASASNLGCIQDSVHLSWSILSQGSQTSKGGVLAGQGDLSGAHRAFPPLGAD